MDMLNAMEKGEQPMETFYDGYVVNAIMDAAYLSMETKHWEPVKLEIWRGSGAQAGRSVAVDYDEDYFLIKQERMPDGRTKRVLKEKKSGAIVQRLD